MHSSNLSDAQSQIVATNESPRRTEIAIDATEQVAETPVMDDSIPSHVMPAAAESAQLAQPPPVSEDTKQDRQRQAQLPQHLQVQDQPVLQVSAPPIAAPKQSIRSVHNLKPPRIIIEHFDLATYKIDTAHGYVEADCRHCSHTIKGQRNVTSNFIQHMRRRHPAAYKQFTANSGSRSKRPRLSSKPDKGHTSLASARANLNGSSSTTVPASAVDPVAPSPSDSIDKGMLCAAPSANIALGAGNVLGTNGGIARVKHERGHSGGKSNIRDRILASTIVESIAAAAAVTPDVTLEKALVSPTYRQAKVTPCEYANELSSKLGCHVWIKREDLQPTGSPIFRAAFNYMASTPTSRSGVTVGMPSALSVALATQKSSKPCIAYVPNNTPAAVVRTLQKYSAVVHMAGETENESCRAALNKGTSVNRTYVDLAGKHLLTGYAEATAGYATLALEILQQLPVADKVFMAAGNALMFSGVSAVLQRLGRGVKLIGVLVSDAAHTSKANEIGSEPMSTDIRENAQDVYESGNNFEGNASNASISCGWIRGRQDASWSEAGGTDSDFDVDGDWKAFVSETVIVSPSEMNAAVKGVFEDCEGAVLSPIGALSVAGAVKYWERQQVSHERFVCVVSDPLRDFDTMRMVASDCFRHDSMQYFTMVDCVARDSDSVVALVAALHNRTDNRARITHLEFDGKWPFILGVTVEDKARHREHLGSVGFRLTAVPHDLSLKELNFGVSDDVCRHALAMAEGISEKVSAFGVRLQESADVVTRFVAEVGRLGRLRTIYYRKDGSAVAHVVLSWYLSSGVDQVEQEIASRVQSFRRLLNA